MSMRLVTTCSLSTKAWFTLVYHVDLLFFSLGNVALFGKQSNFSDVGSSYDFFCFFFLRGFETMRVKEIIPGGEWCGKLCLEVGKVRRTFHTDFFFVGFDKDGFIFYSLLSADL